MFDPSTTKLSITTSVVCSVLAIMSAFALPLSAVMVLLVLALILGQTPGLEIQKNKRSLEWRPLWRYYLAASVLFATSSWIAIVIAGRRMG